MKRFILTIVLVASVFVAFTSCDKMGGSALNVMTAGELKVTSASGYQSIGFSAKGDWTVSSSASWCKLSPTSGSAGDNITVTATYEQNQDVDERKSNIVIRCGDASETVTIVQDAFATLIADKLNYEINYKEQKVEVDLKTNIEYVVDVPSVFAEWITVESTKALHNGKIVLAVKENPATEKRSASIDVHSAPSVPNAGSAAFTINIFQGPKTYLNVKQTNETLPCGANYAYLDIDTNGTPEISVEDANWFGVLDSGSANEHYWVTYYCRPNSLTQDRSFKVRVVLKEDAEFSHEATYTQRGTEEVVDLGLSVKWRAFNLGTNSLEEDGDFFAWGETESKTTYDWNSYKWSSDEQGTLTKYCYTPDQGTVDNKMRLELEDDAAHVILGGNWRIPTNDDFLELIQNCDVEFVMIQPIDINGFIFTSKVAGYEDKSIFIKASGYYQGDSYYTWGTPWIWSSDINTDPDMMGSGIASRYASMFTGGNGDTHEDCIQICRRNRGLPIRPVQDK